jgi:hypothetical protein
MNRIVRPLRPPLPDTPEQLSLPLDLQEKKQTIPVQEVWQTLSLEQQGRFSRQIVHLCCRLIRTTQSKEVHDEE